MTERKTQLLKQKQALLVKWRSVLAELDAIADAEKLRKRKSWSPRRISDDILRRLDRGESPTAVAKLHGKTVAQVKGYQTRSKRWFNRIHAEMEAKHAAADKLEADAREQKRLREIREWPETRLMAGCAVCAVSLAEEPNVCSMCKRCRDAYSLTGCWHSAAMGDRLSEAEVAGIIDPAYWPCYCHDCAARSVDDCRAISKRLGMSLTELFGTRFADKQ